MTDSGCRDPVYNSAANGVGLEVAGSRLATAASWLRSHRRHDATRVTTSLSANCSDSSTRDSRQLVANSIHTVELRRRRRCVLGFSVLRSRQLTFLGHVTTDHSTAYIGHCLLWSFKTESLYLLSFSRYWTLSVLGSQVWLIGVTWRRWSCDHLSPHRPFPLMVHWGCISKGFRDIY